MGTGKLIVDQNFQMLSDNGAAVSIIIKVRDLEKYDKGRFLNRYKVNLIAHELDNPDINFIIDAHKPKGLHQHIDRKSKVKDEGQKLNINELESLLDYFLKEVFKKFKIPNREL